MPELAIRDALREAIRERMLADERVFVMGEDVGEYGGPYGVTKGLIEEFGPDRVMDTPISELAFVGAGVGLVAALGLARVLRTLLVGVSAQDPGIFAAVPATLVVVAILASWLPARRASRIQPVEALRYD